jgi:hypothetical protein
MRSALGLLGILSVATQRPPAEQIRYLMYESERPDVHGTESGHFSVISCGAVIGEDRDNRAIAKSLAVEEAVPAMEEKLDAMAPGIPLNARWLFLAYASARGPAAYARLQRLSWISEDYAGAAEKAIALARNLTAYVSMRNRLPVAPGGFRCTDWGRNPRDVLNAFLREKLGKRENSIGIGYRFQNAGSWSEPEETLEEERSRPPGNGEPMVHELETELQDHTGAACGSVRIRFVPAKRTDFVVGSPTYTIGNPEIVDVLAACAARNPG